MTTTSLAPFAAADLDLLLSLGPRLDHRPPKLAGRSVREFLIGSLLKVRDKRGQLCRLAPNRAQQAFEAAASRRNVVLKARQMGLTTWVAARFFIATITRPGTVTVQVAHDQRSAEEIFRIVHRFLENFDCPRMLGERGAIVTSRANVRQIVFPHLDSEYRVESAADPNAGRGLTIHHLHCSEVARWPGDAEAALASLRAAVPPDGEVVLESTPNGAGGAFYQQWQRAAETGFIRHFFPWFFEPAYAISNTEMTWFRPPSAGKVERSSAATCEPENTNSDLTPDELALIAKHSLTAAQIAFRRDLRANFRRMAEQEFVEDPESCFLASGECVFDLDIVERRLRALPAPAETRDNGRMSIWWPPKSDCHPERDAFRGVAERDTASRAKDLGGPREAASAASGQDRAFGPHPYYRPIANRESFAVHYLLAVDPAGGGVDGDYACAQVLDQRSGLQCAELHGHFSPRELASRVAALAREYGNALVAIERNNHGHAVLAYLTSIERYENLYERNGQLGWLTSAATRPEMIERFAATLAAQPELFSSPRLLAECRTFVRRADGSPAAAGGTHDDCILAMAIALMVRNELAPTPLCSSAAPLGFSLQM